MIKEFYKNQKIIRVVKATSNKENLYGIFNKNATMKALKELKPNTFKLWSYFNLNQGDYEFALSSKEVKEKCGMAWNTYSAAVNELIEKEYLIKVELYPQLEGYLFLEQGMAAE